MPTFELKDARISRIASVAAIGLVNAWHRRRAASLLEGEAPAGEVAGLARLVAGRWSDLLGRMVADRHGGMLVVLPDDSLAGLSLPHVATDLRFGEVIRSFWRGSRSFWDVMRLSESAAPNLLRWNWDRERLFDCIHAIAALTRMDGSVVFNAMLDLKGFGARLPLSPADTGAGLVAVADPVTLEVQERVPLADLALGTRHSAAFSLCRDRPGALAFVVSQEGDLRVFAGHEGQVFLWKAHWQLFSA
jgi:hypothetical protein